MSMWPGFYGPQCSLHHIMLFEPNKKFSWQQVLSESQVQVQLPVLEVQVQVQVK